MVKWIQELILQRYWQERCHLDDYFLGSSRILGARMNPHTDGFPDIIANRIDGRAQPVPAEVEWTTDDFRHHHHPVDELAENDGFLIVWKRTHDFPTPQVEIRRSMFEDWLNRSYSRLLADTVKDVEREIHRSKDPRLWVIWRSGSVARHMEIAIDHGLWGFPSQMNRTRLMNAQAIKPGDTVVFIGPWSGTGVRGVRTGGRVDLRTFMQGSIGGAAAYTVTRGYFEDLNEVWPRHGGELWKHRFGFNPKPILKAEEFPSSAGTLGRSLPDFLRNVMIGRSDPIEIPPSLIPTLLSAVGRKGDA
jgi:hypothetical protein